MNLMNNFFMASVENIELTQEEKATIDWLCGWSPDTIKTLYQLLKR